jgi:hypothetical protein
MLRAGAPVLAEFVVLPSFFLSPEVFIAVVARVIERNS